MNVFGVLFFMKANNIRSRNWSLVLYEDPSVVLGSLLSYSSHYCYVFHNVDESTPHYHLLLILPNAKTFTALRSYHVGSQNILGEPIHDRKQAFRYLFHLDDPGKHQYPYSAAMGDNLAWWQSLDSDTVYSSSGDRTLALLDDLNQNKPLRELIGVYGRDFVIHYDQYVMMARRLHLADMDSGVEPYDESSPLVIFEEPL